MKILKTKIVCWSQNDKKTSCKITKRSQDNKYEIRLYIGRLIFAVCDHKNDLVKYSKNVLAEQIYANQKEYNLLQKDIDAALKELDFKLNKLK